MRSKGQRRAEFVLWFLLFAVISFAVSFLFFSTN
jgi:hypothetical protein